MGVVLGVLVYVLVSVVCDAPAVLLGIGPWWALAWGGVVLVVARAAADRVEDWWERP